MAGATLSNKDTVVQDMFGEGVTNAINVSTVFLNKLPISPKVFDGKQLRENIGYGMPSGGGAYGPSLTAVPSASTSSNIECYIYHCYIYDTIQVDWDVMEQTSGNHAYIAAVKQEMKRVAEYRSVDIERMLMNDGSGFLMPTGFTITVSSTAPLTFTITNGAWLAPRFPVQQRLEAWSLRTKDAVKRSTPAQGYAVILSTSRSGTTLTVTCDSTSNVVGADPPITGDYIAKDEAIVEDNTSSTKNSGNELQGVASMISASNPPLVTNTKAGFAADDTYLGISRTTNSFWQSATTDGTGQYMNVDLMEANADDISIHGSGGGAEKVWAVLAHNFQIRKYRASLYTQERYSNSGTAGSFTAGSTTSYADDKGPMIADKPTIKSRYADIDKAFNLGPGMKHYDLKKWGFADKDGSIWRMNQQGRPAWMANAYCYKAVAGIQPNGSGVVTGLSTT